MGVYLCVCVCAPIQKNKQQVIINGVWMIISPARAMHHYPTREDNLLVCDSYIDASYMIVFSYPIFLIVICTIYAILTRKIPEAFNESKHIGKWINFTFHSICSANIQRAFVFRRREWRNWNTLIQHDTWHSDHLYRRHDIFINQYLCFGCGSPGFTMYTTCVIWLAFVPLYFGTANHVPLRITSMSVTISLSASVTVACLFSPKVRTTRLFH